MLRREEAWREIATIVRMQQVVKVWCVAGLIAASSVWAQPEAASDSAGAGTPQATQETWIDLATLEEGSWRPLADAYRRVALVELWTVQVGDDASSADSGQFTLRLFSGNADKGLVGVVRLDLGQSLIVSASGDRLRAAHAANPRTYVEQSLPGGLDASSILAAMPALPLPQLCLALDGDAASLRERFRGMHARVDAKSGRFAELRWTGASGETVRARARASIVEADASPSTWMLDAAGRDRVPQWSDLAPLPPAVSVGDRVPAMGLFDDAWAGWEWESSLAEIAAKPPQPSGAACAVMVTALVGDPLSSDELTALRTATRAAGNVERDLEIARLTGKVASPRAMVSLVGVIEVADVGPAIVARVRNHLAGAGVDAARLKWTSIGRDALHRIVPDAKVAILVIDADRVLRGVVRVDDRLVDVATLEREVREILDRANQDG